MPQEDVRKLPPMSALEFAIEHTFRNFFFSLRLALGWLIVLLPLLAAAYVLVSSTGMPDPAALPPVAIAVLAALAMVTLLASLSVAVNWHRRILLQETPQSLGWIRLDGVVWKYFGCFGLIVVLLGLVAAAVFAALTLMVPALAPHLGAASAGVAYAVAVMLGLFGLFSWYRLSTWLPAVATGDKDYGAAAAWRATRNNRVRFLGFTFWLLFSLAIAGGVGAGAFFGQQALNNPYATIAAYALTGLIGWLMLFLVTTIATCHYSFFRNHATSLV